MATLDLHGLVPATVTPLARTSSGPGCPTSSRPATSASAVVEAHRGRLRGVAPPSPTLFKSTSRARPTLQGELNRTCTNGYSLRSI
jgi:hypothetical protein